MDVIIFCGQSNMQGFTEGVPNMNEPVLGASEYRWMGDLVVPLRHPVGEGFGGRDANEYFLASNGGSLVPAFCREYVKNTSKEVMAIHVTRGNTTVGEWLRGTGRFHYAIQKIQAGIEKAKSLGEVERIYFVWLQGETDAIIGTTEDEYVQRLKQFKDNIKEFVKIDKFGIIRVGYFCAISEWYRTSVNTAEHGKACDEAIMRAQDRVSKEEDFIMLTDVTSKLSLNPDYINPAAIGHFNNRAMDVIGEKAARILSKIRND